MNDGRGGNNLESSSGTDDPRSHLRHAVLIYDACRSTIGRIWTISDSIIAAQLRARIFVEYMTTGVRSFFASEKGAGCG
jgi:hypothetical protein